MTREEAIEAWFAEDPHGRNMAHFGFGHIVLDDDNTEDGFILWCIREGETNRAEYRDIMNDELMDETLAFLRSLLLIPDDDG